MAFGLKINFEQKKSRRQGGVRGKSNEFADRLGKTAFYRHEIIGENILRSMLAKSYYTVLQLITVIL